jgi:DNA replication protein DnaC
MGYNQENFKRIRTEYETKALLAQRAADGRREEVHQAIPQLRELDQKLSSFGLRIMKLAMEGGNTENAIASLREENQQILAERRQLLESHGYPEDYCKPHYECEDCNDSGYVGIRMCACMRRRLTEAGMESCGLGGLMKKQSFDNFSLDFYRHNREEYARMEQSFRKLKSYAETFEMNPENPPESILLLGGTGLGKTHLSTAIARAVIERGYDVFYNSAVGMISDFECRRFGNASALGDADNTERYLSCDLLILDDLGTEVFNQFTQSTIYFVLNSRLNSGRPTVISSNLKAEDLRKNYSDRITSRLFGEFNLIPFFGIDIRKQKLSR